jgi:hypothetical protein
MSEHLNSCFGTLTGTEGREGAFGILKWPNCALAVPPTRATSVAMSAPETRRRFGMKPPPASYAVGRITRGQRGTERELRGRLGLEGVLARALRKNLVSQTG